MPHVRLKLNHLLRETIDPTGPEEVSIPVLEGESIIELIRRLTAEGVVFRKLVFDEQNQDVLANVLVIHNGSYVSPHDRSQVVLREGDELMLLPMFSGG